MRTSIAVVIGLALSILSGCYEPAGVTWYEAGVYKGAPDPLLKALATEDLQQALEARIRDVQTDR